MAKILFAPDGLHYQIIKKGNISRLWDYFNFDKEIRLQIFLNPQARFKLLGDKNRIIGELPRTKKETKCSSNKKVTGSPIMSKQ